MRTRQAYAWWLGDMNCDRLYDSNDPDWFNHHRFLCGGKQSAPDPTEKPVTEAWRARAKNAGGVLPGPVSGTA